MLGDSRALTGEGMMPLRAVWRRAGRRGCSHDGDVTRLEVCDNIFETLQDHLWRAELLGPEMTSPLAPSMGHWAIAVASSRNQELQCHRVGVPDGEDPRNSFHVAFETGEQSTWSSPAGIDVGPDAEDRPSAGA